jgi:RimJ/RimL family protein N-acetyltransferase
VVDGRVPGMSLEHRLAQHQANFTDGTEWVYGLFNPEGSQVLGGCGLYPRVGPRAVELGYWLAAGHTGRGLATQATAALTRVAFTGDSVDHVEIRCEVENTASARVPARLNYRPMEIVTDGTARLQVWRLSRSDFVGWPAGRSN